MIERRHLGRVSFAEADDLQRALALSQHDYVLLFQHPPTYTKGVRAKEEHFLISPALLEAEVIQTDRGGDITYHGPGQVVAWPVVSVPDDPGAGRAHVGRMEDAVIATVRGLDTAGVLGDVGRLEGYPGVWAGLDSVPHKIAAVGARTMRLDDGRRRTLHGIALNVSVDLGAFRAIVPCGIPDKPVGSLQSLGLSVDDEVVEDLLGRELAQRLGTEERVARVERARAEMTDERPLIRRLRKAGVDLENALPLASRKPEWLRIEAQMGTEYQSLRTLTEDLRLVTVCEEAGCPNIFECWRDGTATFMVNGERCTRNCGFCLIDTRKPLALDPTEPARVAEAVVRLGLHHAVVTCVARDDLDDGGAGAIAQTVLAIREASPHTAVEVLISDLKGSRRDLEVIIDARPDVLNHNIETVARLQHAVRPSAAYHRSLTVLARSAAAGLVTKSGMMVGLGETEPEVQVTLSDLASVGVQIATIGQYLRPSARHVPVARYWEPAEFDHLAEYGRSVGLSHVQSSPLTRSSYHAREALDQTPVALSARR
ncbi:MAG: lipoyl synthase [Acidimicrobiaceae bacterium]|nr:lipoyl synthase [Acidimicrobiaceae bacterium]